MDEQADLSFLASGPPVEIRWPVPGGAPAVLAGWVRSFAARRIVIRPADPEPALAGLRPAQPAMLVAITDDGRYHIPVRIEAIGLEGDLIVQAVGRPDHQQRRRFPRARVAFPPLTATRLGGGGVTPRRLEITLLDLSAGGARFICGEPLVAGEAVQLWLSMEGDAPVAPVLTVLECLPTAREGRVIGRRRPAPAPPATYRTRGAFTGLTDGERRAIAYFVARCILAERRQIARHPARRIVDPEGV